MGVACWVWASNRSAKLAAVGPPAVTKSPNFWAGTPHPPLNKHNRFQHMVPSHIKSCTAHWGGGGPRQKKTFFFNERHMAKKAQIQWARPLRMIVEWACIYIIYDANIKLFEKAWTWHVVPISKHLMDTESEFAPWDLSKAHILVSTPVPNVQTVWPDQTETLHSSHWSNCKFCDLDGRELLNQLTSHGLSKASLPFTLKAPKRNTKTTRKVMCLKPQAVPARGKKPYRAAKFTKNKSDQWNHAGGFSISICASLSLKMQPRNNWLNCRARCMGSEPPKCRRLHASGILRVRIWKG